MVEVTGDGAASGYPASYYTASTRLPPACAPLEGRREADVCVVGGGIAGCSAALALCERGFRVVLLEAQRLGWAASGRNGGQVIHGLALDQKPLERLAGPEDARRIWEMSRWGVERLKERIRTLGIACDWIDGQMYAAVRARHWRGLQEWHAELTTRYGYAGTRLIGREELRAQLDSRRYLGALYDREAGHLHPLRYTLGLAEAAVRHGAVVHEASRVVGFERSAQGVAVRTLHGQVTCRHLLLAGNAWLGATVPSLARKLLPITSYMIATEPLGEVRARQLIGSDAAVCDTRWVLDYFRRSRDHRLLFGGGVSYSGLSVRAIAPAMRRHMLRVFPQLAAARIDYAWSCLVDITANRAPHFGRLAPDVYFLQGFSGHGVALAGIAGELVAEAIAGVAQRFDVFARLPHRDFPGGPARRVLLTLAMLWYRLRDLL